MENIALNKPVSASSYVMPYAASRAVDGQYLTNSPTSRWLCNKLPGWLSINLGVRSWVNRWVVRHMPVAGWRSPDYVNSDFKLQGSNDYSTWYDVDVVAGNTAGVTDRTFTASNYQYFRVYITKGLNCNNQMGSIMEVELYEAPPTSPYLSNLVLSAGTLIPTFSKLTTAYTVTVNNSVSTLTLTPTAEDAKATIIVNGQVVSSGATSQAIPLNVGVNNITVSVTSQIGGLVQNYTIAVTRQQGAKLSGLTAQSGISSIPLLPTPFASTTLAYSTSVGFDISSIAITPTEGQAGSTITVNGTTVASGSASGAISLNVGDNTIPVVVSANGASQTYTVKVTRADSSYLSALTVQSGTAAIPLSPTPFVKTTMDYSASVGADVSSVTVIPTAESSSAVITVKGLPVVSGQASASIALVTGLNSIPVVVTAGGITQTYTITITKVDTSLSGLSLLGIPGNAPMTLSPGFQSAITSYTTTTGKTKITVTPTTGATGSTIKVNNTIVASGSASAQISLTGKTTVTITVTIGSATTTYQVVVN